MMLLSLKNFDFAPRTGNEKKLEFVRILHRPNKIKPLHLLLQQLTNIHDITLQIVLMLTNKLSLGSNAIGQIHPSDNMFSSTMFSNYALELKFTRYYEYWIDDGNVSWNDYVMTVPNNNKLLWPCVCVYVKTIQERSFIQSPTASHWYSTHAFITAK